MRRDEKRRTRRTWVLTVLALAVGCADERGLTFKEPASVSYTTGARKVKIDEAVTTVQGTTVTPSFFPEAGIQPLLGRFFIAADHESSTRRVVVLSHDLWVERFGSSPGIPGRAIELDGGQATVVGVAPRGFSFPKGTLLWTPKPSGAP